MPSAAPRSAIPSRPREGPPRTLKHAPCTSYPESLTLESCSAVQKPSNSYSERPAKRPMTTPSKTIAVVNASGRQAASFIRVASAVGYKVRAQLRNLDGIVASEISSLPHVTVLVGDLYRSPPANSIPTTNSPTLDPKSAGVNKDLINDIFRGAQLAFINTTFWGDEVAIGCALADAAVAAGIEHYIYSSMPNHSLSSPNWPSLPLWSSKYAIESYICKSLPNLPVTFLYTGIYNNNFTSLPYPLFCMALQPDGSFEWEAPFHPDVPLPWLDAEHDVGPAVLQIFKDRPPRPHPRPRRIPLAFEMLSPVQACAAFSRGIGRPVKYVHKEKIEIKVKIPRGYEEQLVSLEEMYKIGRSDPRRQPRYFGDEELENKCPADALSLWEGYRGLEEYAREVFPLEEAANGLTWMDEEAVVDGDVQGGSLDGDGDGSTEDGEDEGLVIGGGLGTGESTPARREETWLA